ncbi:MAG: nucleotidyltransferase family protein [Nitrososphaerales archaeon]
MTKPLKAVILAGGLGTRLHPYTLFMPKPMLPLGDKPVLEHLISWLYSNDIRDIVICVSYLRRIIEDYFRDGKELGVKITYARTNTPMGTAGQLKSAEKLIDGTFLCVYGDSIYDFNVKDMIEFHIKKKALATIALMPYKTTLKYGLIDVSKDGLVKKWREKPTIEGLINIGCYIIEPRFLDYIPNDTRFGMNFAFENAMKKGERIFGYNAKGGFIDIGDKKGYIGVYKKYLGKLGEIV